MKNLFVLFACLISLNLFAQNPAYDRAMTNAMTQFKAGEGIEDMQASANTFSRIAGMAPTEWIPSYYACLANLNLAFMHMKTDEDKAEKFLEVAQTHIATAENIKPNESEIYTLLAYTLIAEVSMSPMVKGPLMSSTVFSTLETAVELNANNPRAHYLTGMYTLNMPAFFGGGAENAKPHVEKAVELYTSELAANDFMPTWGKYSAESMLKSITVKSK